MFERAKLPNEVLGKIWNIADVEQRGALNLTEFTIAMHLLTSMRSGALRALPQTLPPGLYEAASRRPALATGSVTAVGGIPRQFTGQGHQRTASPLTRPIAPQEIAPQGTGNDWLVTPQDKAKFDQIFATVDKAGVGQINGDQAVQFFSNSGLSEDMLATIWDLSDIRSEGQLNKEEFAVAMYLIRQQRGKRDDRDSLPSSLPPNLIPPSMRQKAVPPSHPTAPAFDNAAFASLEQPKSASEDLFGLDAFGSDFSAPQQSSVPTSSVQPYPFDPFQPFQPIQLTQPPQPLQPSQMPQTAMPPPPTSSTVFKPFVPSSAFGQGIVPQDTGGTAQVNASQSREIPRQPQSNADDLLGDNDPEISTRITDEAMEFGNMSNQISTLRTQTQEIQNKKTTAENNLLTNSNQKRDLEGRLGQIRAQYEQEVGQVKSLEERLNVSRNDTRKLQQELAMLEGTHQDLLNQKQQIVTALEADQRENAALKERIRQINTEAAELRPQAEKMKSDARQQKGLVAINKKQLATSEAERDKIQSEINDAWKEHEDAVREQNEAIAGLERAQQEVSQLRTTTQQQATQQQAQREATRQRMAAQHESLQRERAQHETEQREEAQREAEHQDMMQREAARQESERQEISQRELAQRDAAFSSTSPAASVVSPSTNPFFRMSPQPTAERVLSPSMFTQDLGQPAPADDFDSFFGSIEPPSQSAEHQGSNQEAQEMPEASMMDSSAPATPFTRALEPPAPPQSRQMNSNFLPFRTDLARSESFSSSVRANPPASRSGMSVTGTPMQNPSSSSTSVNGESSPITGNSQGQQVDTAVAQTPMQNNVFKGAEDNERSIPRPKVSPPARIPVEDIPGAFPDSPVASTPTGGSVASEKGYDNAANASRSTLGDPFATREDQATFTSASRDDASVSSKDSWPVSRGIPAASEEVPVSATTGNNRANTEFPPIQEFDHGDDSNSDSESDAGLDDEFAGMSAAREETDDVPHGEAISTSGPITSSFDQAPVANQTVAEIGASSKSLPPTPDAQQSPPTYDQTMPQTNIGEHRDSNTFPREYGGLLPSREIASSPPLEVPQSPPQSLSAAAFGSEPPSGVNTGPYQPQYSAGRATMSSFTPGPPSFLSGGTFQPPWLANKPAESGLTTGLPSGTFGGSSSQPQSEPAKVAAPVPASSGDDFDEEFADLDEAREVDDQGHDAFVIPSARKDGSEFDPAFENINPVNPSSLNFGGAASSATLAQAPSANRSSDFGIGSSASSFHAKQTPGSDAFSSFSPSASIAGSSAQGFQPSPTQPPNKETASGAHDWDSIFAAADVNTSSVTQSNGKDPFALDDHIGPALPRPQQQQQQQPQQQPQQSQQQPQQPQQQPQQPQSQPQQPQPQRNVNNLIGPTLPPQQQNNKPGRVDHYVAPFLPFRNQPQQRQQPTVPPQQQRQPSPPQQQQVQPQQIQQPPRPLQSQQIQQPPRPQQPQTQQSQPRPQQPQPPQLQQQQQQQPQRPPQQSQQSFNQQQRYQPPQSPPINVKVNRPEPGRALSSGTEHDDPILKNLTSMGFNREDALKTLERFDYNIDKVGFPWVCFMG